jgi:DNA processing protein
MSRLMYSCFSPARCGESVLSGLTDDESCMIALCATERIGAATARRLMSAARRCALPMAELLRAEAEEISRLAGLRSCEARAACQLHSPILKGRRILDLLERAGGTALFEGRCPYPRSLSTHLREDAPPVLFARGDVAVLDRPHVAVVGSRRPSSASGRAARVLTERLAAAGHVIVSGGAHGIDAAAHRAALRTGATVICPAQGLMTYPWRGLAPPDDPAGHWCLAGHAPPDARWRARYALARNQTMVALSRAVVAFEPRDVGGTASSAKAAIRMGKPLFVVSTVRTGAKGRGLRGLVLRGAMVLDPGRMPEVQEFDALVAEWGPRRPDSQLRLFASRRARRTDPDDAGTPDQADA